MKWAYHPTAGFRFSIIDLMAVLVCAGATIAAWRWIDHLAILFPIVLGHFFLFCNIFRIRRSYELIWAATFIANFGWHLMKSGGKIDWLTVLAIQTPITALMIALEMRGGRYHGIGYSVINPEAKNHKRSGSDSSNETV